MDYAAMKYLSTARIDIKNQGDGNDLKMTVLDGDRCSITHPAWFAKAGTGYMLMTEDQHLLLELECVGAGNLMIRLQGINKLTSEGIRIPLWVDYTRLSVNDEIVFWELKSQWHDKLYIFNKKVSDGEVVKVEISWSEHAYKGKDLAQLLSMWETMSKSK